MNWKNLWDKAASWSKGLKAYAGTALYAIGQYNSGVVWHVGGLGIPAGEILQAVGAALGGIGLAGKAQAYQQARQQGLSRTQAVGHAATRGPVFDRLKGIRGESSPD